MKSIMKKLVIMVIWASMANIGYGQVRQLIVLSPQVLKSNQLAFAAHYGPSPFDNALAMNIPYQPIAEVRHQLSRVMSYQLNFFKGWSVNGEAHVTVITPPEYATVLSKYVSIQKINEIAIRNAIQNSDLQFLGLGRGQAMIDRQLQSTYFIIVYSKNLIFIRQQIYQEYLKNGGPKEGWNPLHFYPHITVGFTLRDLHEQDGVLKDVTHSLDPRFQLVWKN